MADSARAAAPDQVVVFPADRWVDFLPALALVFRWVDRVASSVASAR